jgi:hypothetical protein
MVATLGNFEPPWIALDAVDKSMFPGDPSRPPARKRVSEGFGLTDAFEGIATDIFDQPFDVFRYLVVGPLPVLEVFPRLRGP